jgi:HEAT repeat protein
MNDIHQELLRLIDLNNAKQWVPEDTAYQELLDRHGNRLVPGLIQCLTDEDSEVRRLAVSLLSEARPISDVAIPALIDRLSDEDRLVRNSTMWSLMEFGHAARSAVPALKQFLDDYSEPYMRIIAAGTISRIAPEDPAATPILVEGLRDPVGIHRVTACEFLGEVRGTSVTPSIPLLSDNETLVRFAAAEAIGKLVGEWYYAVVECVRQLGDTDEYVRYMGRENLMSLDHHAKAAIPMLKARVDTVRWEVRLDIEEVLWELRGQWPD